MVKIDLSSSPLYLCIYVRNCTSDQQGHTDTHRQAECTNTCHRCECKANCGGKFAFKQRHFLQCIEQIDIERNNTSFIHSASAQMHILRLSRQNTNEFSFCFRVIRVLLTNLPTYYNTYRVHVFS